MLVTARSLRLHAPRWRRVLVSSFQRATCGATWFLRHRLLTARVTPPASRYPEDKELRAFTYRLLEEIRKAPGVQSAGITSNLPFGGAFNDSVILAEGYRWRRENRSSHPSACRYPGLHGDAAVPLVKGRFFAESDTETHRRSVIVDASSRASSGLTRDPIGRRMFKPGDGPDLTKPSATPPGTPWWGRGRNQMGGLVGGEETRGRLLFPMAQSVERTLTLAVRTVGPH